MHEGTDSSEVMEFMALFARIKRYTDNEPDRLASLAEDNQTIHTCCEALHAVARELKNAETSRRELSAAPVSFRFKDAWRDYESRYGSVVDSVIIPWAVSRFKDPEGHADLNSQMAEFFINETFTFASFTSSLEQFSDYEVEGVTLPIDDIVDYGIHFWEEIKDMGVDAAGILRRRSLVPFVLVPRAVKHGTPQGEKLSLLHKLQEAHDAFIFGLPLAALTLMRAVMEKVLRTYYATEKETLKTDLKGLIEKASPHLPDGVNRATLHRLRELANDVLHHRTSNRFAPFAEMPPEQLEREFVLFFGKLRALIEEAPKK